MKKKIVCILFVFLITGCGSKNSSRIVSYNLNISDSYDEEISIALPKNAYEIAEKKSPKKGQYISLEYNLLHEDVFPITTSDSIVYKKKIKKYDNQVNVNLTYNYLEKDFLNESYIYQCFENYELNSFDDYFEISLSGKYFCNNHFDKLEINVTNSNYVIDTNGTSTKDGYSWTIDKNNSSNVNIYYKFSRDYGSMATKVSQNDDGIFKRLFSASILAVMIIGCIFLYKVYKRYKYINMSMDV